MSFEIFMQNIKYEIVVHAFLITQYFFACTGDTHYGLIGTYAALCKEEVCWGLKLYFPI